MTGVLGRCRAGIAGALLLLCALGARAEHIVLESYQEREGLANLSPSCLAQDGQTLLWVCTENGLFRFDGFRMRRESLPREAGARIDAARIDRAGRLWVGAEGGLFIRQHDARGTRWVAVRKPDGRMVSLNRPRQLDWDDAGVAYVMDVDNRLWSIAPGAPEATALVARPLATPRMGAPPGVVPPLRWHGGALWFGCDERLCEWRDQRLKTWGPEEGLPADGWANLLVARDGSLWARSGRQLAHLASGATRFEAVDAPAVVGGWINYVALAEDREGAILTTTDKGVARWNGNAWRQWTEADGLPDTAIRALLFDAEGSLWLGAGGRGVYRWVGYGQVDHWRRADGLPSNVVMSMLQDASGRLWATTREGVAWFDEPQRRFVPLQMPGQQRVRSWRLSMIADGDLWWIENDQLFTVKAGGATPRLVARDKLLSGALMVRGAYYVFGQTFVERWALTRDGPRRERVADSLPGGERATGAAGDGRSDWFITDGQVGRLKDGAWTPLLDTAGVPVPAHLDLSFDPAGGLWIFDGTGVGHYAVENGVARQLRRFPLELFGGAVPYFVHGEASGRVWIGTDQGVFILDPDGRWQHLHHGNGLVWNDVDPGFLIDAQGQAWISTSAGVTRVRAGVQWPQQPVLRVDQVEFGARAFPGPPTQPVPWDDRRLRVTLGTANYSLARSLRIEYRVGPDAPWRTAETAVLDIGALEAGVQLLQVRAVARSPAEPAGPVLTMPFEVLQPWWNTLAARVAGALLVALLWWGSWWVLQRRARAPAGAGAGHHRAHCGAGSLARGAASPWRAQRAQPRRRAQARLAGVARRVRPAAGGVAHGGVGGGQARRSGRRLDVVRAARPVASAAGQARRHDAQPGVAAEAAGPRWRPARGVALAGERVQPGDRRELHRGRGCGLARTVPGPGHDGVPHRAGVAEQRAAPCAGQPREHPAGRRGRPMADDCARRRPGLRPRPPPARLRRARHGGAGPPAGRPARRAERPRPRHRGAPALRDVAASAVYRARGSGTGAVAGFVAS